MSVFHQTRVSETQKHPHVFLKTSIIFADYVIILSAAKQSEIRLINRQTQFT